MTRMLNRALNRARVSKAPQALQTLRTGVLCLALSLVGLIALSLLAMENHAYAQAQKQGAERSAADSLQPELIQADAAAAKAISTKAATTKAAAKPDDSLRIFVETRDESRPDVSYVSLLSITKGSGMLTFELRKKSGDAKSLFAKLTRAEEKKLFSMLNLKALAALKPETDPAIALMKQAIAVQHKGTVAQLRYMIDPQDYDPEAINASIKSQLGAAYKPHWRFLEFVRAINARFKFR
jgi:hypothetical protein